MTTRGERYQRMGEIYKQIRAMNSEYGLVYGEWKAAEDAVAAAAENTHRMKQEMDAAHKAWGAASDAARVKSIECRDMTMRMAGLQSELLTLAIEEIDLERNIDSGER